MVQKVNKDLFPWLPPLSLFLFFTCMSINFHYIESQTNISSPIDKEYDDDTTIIPRSTTVVARRLPSMKPGAGRAARYVSGKAPVNAKNSSRKEQVAKASTTKAPSAALAQMSNAVTEEERLAAMFQAQSEQWTAQQEELSQ